MKGHEKIYKKFSLHLKHTCFAYLRDFFSKKIFIAIQTYVFCIAKRYFLTLTLSFWCVRKQRGTRLSKWLCKMCMLQLQWKTFWLRIIFERIVHTVRATNSCVFVCVCVCVCTYAYVHYVRTYAGLGVLVTSTSMYECIDHETAFFLHWKWLWLNCNGLFNLRPRIAMKKFRAGVFEKFDRLF